MKRLIAFLTLAAMLTIGITKVTFAQDEVQESTTVEATDATAVGRIEPVEEEQLHRRTCIR